MVQPHSQEGMESERHKMFWDFPIQTDHHVKASKPDIVVLDKNTRECLINDVAALLIQESVVKPRKISRNIQDLKREVQRGKHKESRSYQF